MLQLAATSSFSTSDYFIFWPSTEQKLARCVVWDFALPCEIPQLFPASCSLTSCA